MFELTLILTLTVGGRIRVRVQTLNLHNPVYM